MKNRVLIITFFCSLILFPMSISASELSCNSASTINLAGYTCGHVYYETSCPAANDTYIDTDWLNGGEMVYGCNTEGIDELITHYRETRGSGTYRAVSKSSSHGPYSSTSHSGGSWAKEEITYHGGQQEHGIVRNY